jgi:hypothetical protein
LPTVPWGFPLFWEEGNKLFCPPMLSSHPELPWQTDWPPGFVGVVDHMLRLGAHKCVSLPVTFNRATQVQNCCGISCVALPSAYGIIRLSPLMGTTWQEHPRASILLSLSQSLSLQLNTALCQ